MTGTEKQIKYAEAIKANALDFCRRRIQSIDEKRVRCQKEERGIIIDLWNDEYACWIELFTYIEQASPDKASTIIAQRHRLSEDALADFVLNRVRAVRAKRTREASERKSIWSGD